MTEPFPPDEFDVGDPGTGRRGAHRAKPNPLAAVVPLVMVTIAVVAIIVGAMTMTGGAGTPAGVADPVADTPSATTTQEPAEPAPTQPPQSATPTETAEPEATVDPSLPVSVLNGTRTSGLAAAAAEALTAAGYNVASVDNFRQGTPPPTTVYYSTEEAAATAEAIAEELGVTMTQLDVERGEGIVVILGDDYTP